MLRPGPFLLAAAALAALPLRAAIRPDGHIVYDSPRDSQFALIDMRTGATRLLGAKGYDPALSPDGRTLAYRDNHDKLHVRSVADGRDQTFATPDTDQYAPVFVDSNTVAYVQETRREVRICVSPVSRFEERVWPGRLPANFRRGEIAAVPDPRGGQPAFVITAGRDLLLASTGGLRRLASAMEGENIRYPVVSPNGKQVAFVRNIARYDICTVDLTTGLERKVTRTGDCSWPAWSPDGRYIAYLTTAAVSRGLRTVDPTGREVGHGIGAFLQRLAVMRADGSEAVGIADGVGRIVHVSGDRIAWR